MEGEGTGYLQKYGVEGGEDLREIGMLLERGIESV